MDKKQEKLLVVAVIIFFLIIMWSASNAQVWHGVEDGIEKATIGEDVWVFKIDQNKMNFYVRGSNTNSKSLPEWAEYAAGGINLNMFTVGSVPNGYTKVEGKVIQPTVRKDYNGFIVWNADTLVIMDRYADGLKEIMQWPNISQNIRMIADGENKWQVDTKKWSVSTLATTTSGDVLAIHSRYPYTMHDYIDMLLEADLDIHRMVYLEGGPESQIAVYGHFSRPLRGWALRNQRMGSYETGFVEHDEIDTFWRIPWALCFKDK